MQLVQNYNADVNIVNGEGMSPLMITSKAGDHILTDTLMCVLGADPDLQSRDVQYTALHYACLDNHVDTVGVLLKRGADFNIEDPQKMRPDDLAVDFNEQECSHLIDIHRKQRTSQIMKYIEQDILTKDYLKMTDLCTTDPETGYTLVMYAAKMNKVKSLRLLLNYQSSPINAQHEKTMQTALSFAADEGNIEAMDILLEHGCIPAVLDIERLIPIHHAVRNNHVEFVNRFLQKPGCLLGLELALTISHTDEMKRVLKVAMNRRQREIVTPCLFECAMSGDAGKLYCLLEEGDCINPVSSMGMWPLYLAVENQYMDVIRLLCQNGADLTRKHSSTGNTILHLACSRGFHEVTIFLLECCKAEKSFVTTDPKHAIHAMNYDNKTALQLAAEKGHSKVVALLLQHGASTAILNVQGELYSCQQFEGCQSLLEKCRSQHIKAVFMALREGFKNLKLVFLPQFDHNLRDERGCTPLMKACLKQDITIVSFLLESAIYILEHSKNFQGSFARSYVSSRHDSDSGKHTSNQENITEGICQCRINNSKKEELPGTVDSVVGMDSLVDRCQYCLGNSQENLCSLGNCSYNNNKKNKVDCPVCRNEIEKVTKESVRFGLGDEGCLCSKCSKDNSSSSYKKQVERTNVSHPQGLSLTKSNSAKTLPEEEEYEQQIQDNMTALFTSITSVNNRGSIFVTEIMISHLCATNSVDGSTCFHSLIEGGDNIAILEKLLEVDHTGVNIQDNLGLAPVHFACQLNRRKIAEKLTSLTYVDLNLRTLDGKLPEEMTTDKRIHRFILRARNLEPTK